MKSSQKANLVIAVGLAAVVMAGLFYASWLRDWLRSSDQVKARAEQSAQRREELAAARAAFRRDLLDPAAHVRLGEALYRAGRPIDAFYVLYAGKALFGEAPFLRAHAQVVLYRGGFFLGPDEEYDPSPASESRLRKIIESDPGNPRALQYLARILAGRGQGKEAEKLLGTLLSYSPDDRGGLSYRAQLLAQRGDRAAAVEDWTRLAAAHPGTHEARAALEELGSLAQKPDAGGGEGRLAREALEELLRRAPDDARVFAAAAMAAWGRGDLPAVGAMADEAERRKAGNPGAAMIRGALALKDQDPEKALRSFTKAWEADPDDLYSAAKLSQLYHRQRADPEAALPFDLALYRANPAYDDGEPVEKRILQTLEGRRQHLAVPGGAEGLSRFLASEDASLRAEACVRAAVLGDARWIEPLGELLDDDVELVRQAADYALFQTAKKFPDAVRVRRDEWLGSERPLLRIRALNLFADLEPNETFPLVARGLRDPHPAVRFFARVMVLDHYYARLPAAAKVRAEHLAAEKDPRVLALYARLPSR